VFGTVNQIAAVTDRGAAPRPGAASSRGRRDRHGGRGWPRVRCVRAWDRGRLGSLRLSVWVWLLSGPGLLPAAGPLLWPSELLGSVLPALLRVLTPPRSSRQPPPVRAHCASSNKSLPFSSPFTPQTSVSEVFKTDIPGPPRV